MPTAYRQASHGGNRVKFVSNHFNGVRTNRVFRVDPVVRFNVSTLADTGAPRARMTPGIGSPETAVDFMFVESKSIDVFSEWGMIGRRGRRERFSVRPAVGYALGVQGPLRWLRTFSPDDEINGADDDDRKEDVKEQVHGRLLINDKFCRRFICPVITTLQRLSHGWP